MLLEENAEQVEQYRTTATVEGKKKKEKTTQLLWASCKTISPPLPSLDFSLCIGRDRERWQKGVRILDTTTRCRVQETSSVT